MDERAAKSAVTLLVLALVLVAGVLAGWQMLTRPLPDVTAAPTEQCETVERGSRLTAKKVVVSVYNASRRSGLAGETLTALERRGFTPGEAGNAPEDARVRAVEVWAQDPDDSAARLVALQFGRRVPVVEKSEPLGPGPDVVVGQRYRGLVKAPRSIKVTTTEEQCVPLE